MINDSLHLFFSLNMISSFAWRIPSTWIKRSDAQISSFCSLIYLGEKAAAVCLWWLVLVSSQCLCSYRIGRSRWSSWWNRRRNGGRGQSLPRDSSHSGRPDLEESRHIQGVELFAVPWATAPKPLPAKEALQIQAPLSEVGIVPLVALEESQHLKHRKR